MGKFLDDTGLSYFWGKLKTYFVAKEAGKGLSTNDLDATLKSNYDAAYSHSGAAHAPSGAEANVQSDWNQTNDQLDDFIKNKPSVVGATDETVTFTDVSTNNASTTKHGFSPKVVAPAAGNRSVLGVDNGETVRGDKLLLDTTNPSTQAFGDSAAPGESLKAARVDHKHAMMAAPTLSGLGGIPSSEKGQASGVATLGGDGLVPSSQLPSYVDDVIEFVSMVATAPETCTTGDIYYNTSTKKIHTATGTNTWGTGIDPLAGKIYINKATEISYRWGGSVMVVITSTDLVAITNGEIDTVIAT